VPAPGTAPAAGGRAPRAPARPVGRTVTLSDARVGIRHVIRVARDHAPVAIGPGVVERLTRARAIVDRAAERRSGLRSTRRWALTRARLAKGERASIRCARFARAPSRGSPFGADVVRCDVHAAAGSARRLRRFLPVFRALIDALNADIVPYVPGRGSIGVADLPQLARRARPDRRSEALVDGARVPGGDALAAAGLAPVTLAAGRTRADQRERVRSAARASCSRTWRTLAPHRRRRAVVRSFSRTCRRSIPARKPRGPHPGRPKLPRES
jgi:hypothetical protein